MTLRPIWGRNHTVWIADDLWVIADREARRRGESIYHVINEAIRAFVPADPEITQEAETNTKESGLAPRPRPNTEQSGVSPRERELMIAKYGKDSPLVKALDT